MFDQVLKLFREKIIEKHYVMTLHAEEEMNDDNLSIYDVEEIILSGAIQERQRDKKTAEWKYRIRGETSVGREGEAEGGRGEADADAKGDHGHGRETRRTTELADGLANLDARRQGHDCLLARGMRGSVT